MSGPADRSRNEARAIGWIDEVRALWRGGVYVLAEGLS